jgi:hypothetical protein
VEGLEGSVLVRQADERNVELFLRYTLSITMEKCPAQEAMQRDIMLNKPDAANPAMVSQFHAGPPWRGVADPGRSAVNP